MTSFSLLLVFLEDENTHCQQNFRDFQTQFSFDLEIIFKVLLRYPLYKNFLCRKVKLNVVKN